MKKKVLFPLIALVLVLGLAIPMAAPVAVAAPANLVGNGGFEAPILPDTWECYPTGTTGLVWTVDMVAGGPSIDGLELQKIWTPAEGNQYAELDGYEPDTIYQDLTTVTDGVYLLSFAFSPRPDTPTADNKLEVKWGGVVVDDTIQADGTGLTDTSWTYYSYVVQASGTSTELRFTDLGVAQVGGGSGTFLDDVSVVPISIAIEKTADRAHAYEGDTINYTYTVHNDGDVAVGSVAVFDSLPITPTPILVPPRPGFNIGDLNQDGVLDPCEYWQFTASYTVPDPCGRSVIPNTATAIAGTGYEPITRVSDESELVEVRILHPCIELEKWTVEEPPAYYNGTEITYYYGLHNCGDTELEILVVRDTTLEEDATEVLGRDGLHNRGDLNNNYAFEPCETWYFSLDHTLVCETDTYSDFCNTAMAGAFEPILESRVVVRDVTWKVRIFQWLPRTIGFWGNWDNHIAVEDMRQLVADVDDQSTYFGLADPGPTAGGAVRNLLERMKGKMDADKAEKMLAKQLLAAWLSVKSYENYGSYGDLNWAMNPDAIVYIDTDGDGVPDTADGTVKELLYRIENAIGSMDKDGLLLAKDILEAMNSAESNHYLMFMDPDFDSLDP